jgi:hypothetical protein
MSGVFTDLDETIAINYLNWDNPIYVAFKIYFQQKILSRNVFTFPILISNIIPCQSKCHLWQVTDLQYTPLKLDMSTWPAV